LSSLSGTDANCGNPLIISIDELIQEGLIDVKNAPAKVPVGNIDYPAVMAAKTPALRFAAARLLGDNKFKDLREKMTIFR
jgi:4-alpha-glucanotransferase